MSTKRTHFMDAQRAVYKGGINGWINRGWRARLSRENRATAAAYHARTRAAAIEARS